MTADDRPDEAALAHVFKVTTDPFVGKLAVFRVHQGKSRRAARSSSATTRSRSSSGTCSSSRARSTRRSTEIVAGDIGAVAKIEEIHTNDVLHDDHARTASHLKPLSSRRRCSAWPSRPRRAATSRSSRRAAQDREEDPTFQVEHDRQTHEVVINGLGELHLRLVLEKLAQPSGWTSTPSRRRSPTARRSRDAPTATTATRSRPAAPGSSARCSCESSRCRAARGSRSSTRSRRHRSRASSSPRSRKASTTCSTARRRRLPAPGRPRRVNDGKHHPVDSKEVAFRTAGKHAFRDAVMKARPSCSSRSSTWRSSPEDKMGTITGDLSGKRGQIQGTDSPRRAPCRSPRRRRSPSSSIIQRA